MIARSLDYTSFIIFLFSTFLRHVGLGRLIKGPRSDGEKLILHLALYTPAQVWSLRLNERADDQGWSLRDCAIE